MKLFCMVYRHEWHPKQKILSKMLIPHYRYMNGFKHEGNATLAMVCGIYGRSAWTNTLKFCTKNCKLTTKMCNTLMGVSMVELTKNVLKCLETVIFMFKRLKSLSKCCWKWLTFHSDLNFVWVLKSRRPRWDIQNLSFKVMLKASG